MRCGLTDLVVCNLSVNLAVMVCIVSAEPGSMQFLNHTEFNTVLLAS